MITTCVKKTIALIILIFFCASAVNLQGGVLHKKNTDMKWWRAARFGLFIHWGIYSVPAGTWKGQTGYAEWIRNNARIPLKEYSKFAAKFDPVKFNPYKWVKTAKDAGMKYIIITAKHHDGFCMFDSKYTNFDIMSTPYKRDVLKELADAAHKAGIRIGFYYSIMDWHHPDYLPRRAWEKDRPVKGADFNLYIKYMKNQLHELLTNYGKISVLWFDGNWENTWKEKYAKEIYSYVKSIQPGIIVNDRLSVRKSNFDVDGGEDVIGDYKTPEQTIPAAGYAGTDWETCMTMNDHWGYNKHDNNWKSAKELIHNLATIASKGGNFLLNVGPTSEGEFPEASVERLREIGKWMKINGGSIYNTKAGPFKELSWGCATEKDIPGGTRLYLQVFNWPVGGKLIIPGIQNIPLKAYLLSDPSRKSLTVKRSEDKLVISVPEAAPDSLNSVVVLDVKGKPEIYNAPEIKADMNIFIDSLRVTSVYDKRDVQIRYTSDGSVPSAGSPRYNKEIVITKTSDISVRAFKNNSPVSPVRKRTFKKVAPEKSVNVNNPENGLYYKYYEGQWRRLPDFDTIKSAGSGTANNFEIPKIDRKENFALSYNGYIKIPVNGVYKFYLGSDDGSRMYLDGRMLINNDELHAMKVDSSEAALSRGFHPVRIDFFQKGGGYGLKIQYGTYGGFRRTIPDSLLFISKGKTSE